jgi:hypothetical protein
MLVGNDSEEPTVFIQERKANNGRASSQYRV